MKPQLSPLARTENEVVRLVWIAIFVSVFSLMFYNRSEEILLYGDAVAHINIARRVFDSKTPGLLQLGTVWLPLPHLLIVPFVISNKMWQTGIGGSVPSMAGFVFGTLGIFRLMRTVLARNGSLDDEAKVWSWLAAISYAANPNLIYMQATAMNEPLYLAFFIWAVLYFSEFMQAAAGDEVKANRSVIKCGFCLTAACLTRYDGWFLAALMIIALIAINAKNSNADKAAAIAHRAILIFLLFAIAGPVLWLTYNGAVYRNPLEFANGPYSPKAIEIRTATVNPAKGNPLTAGSYFLKSAELNVGAPEWQGRLWLFLALIGGIAAIFTRRGRPHRALFLWAPLPFYAISIAYGSVPIFVPTWWPFSFYNLRYGLELLPAFAIFVPLGISFLAQWIGKLLGSQSSLSRWTPVFAVVACLVLVGASYAIVWRADPVCFREAAINSRGRTAIDRQLATWFTSFPPSSTLLMYLGEHSGALEQAGIPLRRVINEGNHRVWKEPFDPQGLWERALADPAVYADFAIGFEGDLVWKAATERHLTALVEIHTTGQPAAAIFQTHPTGVNADSH